MYLIFVDESGDPGKPKSSSIYPIFVVASFIVNEKDWEFVRNELQALKKSAGATTLTEIKWSDCMQRVGHSNPKRQNPLEKLNDEERDNFAIQVLNIVRKTINSRVVFCEINKTLAYSRPDITEASHIYNEGTLLVLERVQYFLSAKNSKGIIIQDSRNNQQDQRLRSFYGSLISKGSYWTQFPNIIEGVFLSPSDYSIGLQIADFCAGAVGRASRLHPRKENKFYYEISGRITSREKDGVNRGGKKHWPDGP